MIEPRTPVDFDKLSRFDRYAISLRAPSITQKIGIALLVVGILACIVGAAIPCIGALAGHAISPMASQASEGLLHGGLGAMLLGVALIALPMLGVNYMKEFQKRVEKQQAEHRRSEIAHTAADTRGNTPLLAPSTNRDDVD